MNNQIIQKNCLFLIDQAQFTVFLEEKALLEDALPASPAWSTMTDDYETAKRQLPDLGEEIHTPYGDGKVVGLNILERVIQIEIPAKERVIEYTLDELIEEGIFVQATD